VLRFREFGLPNSSKYQGPSIIVIGLIGFAAERLVFGLLEGVNIYRWGMASVAKGRDGKN
jgi:hypothetical protein